MKQVLVLTCNYYPAFHGGVPRVAKFCTYLQNNGWQPVLVCRDSRGPDTVQRTNAPDRCEVIRVTDPQPYLSLPRWRRGLRMATRRYRRTVEDAQYIQLEKAMYTETYRLCEERKFDAIFASSLPPYVHRIADKLSRKYGIPWIADFRDVAGQVPLPKRSWIRDLSEAANERNAIRLDTKFTRSAHTLLTTGDFAAALISSRTGREVQVIPNGFDPNDLPTDLSAAPHEKMTLVYTGSLWNGCDPRPLFRGLVELQSWRPETYHGIQVQFFGPCEKEITSFLQSDGWASLRDVVQYGGRLTHEDALTRQMQADALVLLTFRTQGIATGKVYEYMATGKPILAVPGDGDIADWLVTQSGLGVAASTPEAIAETLHAWYTQWARDGLIAVSPNHAFINGYTRQAQAKKLAELLDATQKGR